MVAVNIATHSTAVGSGQRAAIADVSARPRQLPHPSDRPAAQLGMSSLAPTALRQDAVPAPTASMPGELTPAQLLAKYRQYNPTVDGPGSSVLGRLLRDYARYNPTVDAVPALTAAATTRQWCASPRHIGFMGLRFVSCASTMGYGNSRADN
jgi:hypothetical protein